MSDIFEFTFHSPLTQDDWNKLHEKTIFITFQTPQGRQVRYMKCEVLDKIRSEIEWIRSHKAQFLTNDNKICVDSQAVLDIIDKYNAESKPTGAEGVKNDD